ncbi:MAG: UDP-N-acetylmuramate--L-alanine ligase [Clostridia bacterium]|nr:UDP-N-acetylmuramate--L-alanine ligase [Clostridia bacterium]
MIDKSKGRVHFIGVGGISMSALAEILLGEGFAVSGSDRTNSPLITSLEEKGLTFYNGHSEKNITDDTALVVYTVAVKYDNPELIEARRRGIDVIPRSRLLGEIMEKYKYTMAVAGTHGKTTTTSMLAYIFTYAKKDPTIIVGGGLDLLNKKTLRLGKSQYLIAEACEYYRSFLDFKPFCATVLNIEPDHLDYYKDKEDFQSAFVDFIHNIIPGGYLIACIDDPDMDRIIKEAKANIITYGIEKDADFTAKDIEFNDGYPTYTLVIKGEEICKVTLSVTGSHNILNSLAALANAYVLDIDMKQAAEYVGMFKGAVRRFEYKFDVNGAKVYDDYAHHPTEVKATVESAVKLPHNKLYCVFQPHTYSRAKTFLDKFAGSFKGADRVIVADIYAAREPFDGSISSQIIAERICQQGVDAVGISGNDKIAEYIKSKAMPGDIVVIMGAGDIFKIYELF